MKRIISFSLTLIMLFSVVSFALPTSMAATEYPYGDYTYTVSGSNATIVSYPETASGSVNIPSKFNAYTVTAIAAYSFYGCTLLTDVKIPNTVTSIGNYAFGYCTSLTSIDIPSSVTSIGANAFKNSNKVSFICEPGSYAEQYARDKGIPVGSSGTIGTITFAQSVYECEVGEEFPISGTYTSDGDVRDLSFSWSVEGASIDSLLNRPGSVINNALEKVFYFSIMAKFTVAGTFKVTIKAFDGATATCTVRVGLSDSEEDFIRKHVGFASSDYFRYTKDLNPARALADKINVGHQNWYDFLSLNYFTNYYDVAIALVLNSEIGQSSFADLIDTYSAGPLREILSDIVDVINTVAQEPFEEIELLEIFTAKDLSQYKETPRYKELSRIVGEGKNSLLARVFKGTDYINRGLSFISAAADALDGFVDCVRYVSLLRSYMASTQEFKTVFSEVANQTKQNEKLYEAMRRYSNIGSEEDYIVFADAAYQHWREVKTRKSVKILCSLMGGSLIKGTIQLGLSIGVAAGGTLGQQVIKVGGRALTVSEAVMGGVNGFFLGHALSNLISNAGGVSYWGATLKSLGELSDSIWVVLTQREQMLLNDQTYLNATLFDNAFNLYRTTQLETCEAFFNAVKENDEGGLFGGIFNVRKWFDLHTDTSDATRYKNIFERIRCHYEMNGSSNVKITKIACPVDVHLYDSNNNKALQIINGVVTVYDERLTAVEIDSEKYIAIPADEDYRITINATDNGTMSYMVSEYSNNDLKRIVSKEDISLARNERFTGTINTVLNTPVRNYQLSSSRQGTVTLSDTKHVPVKSVLLNNSSISMNANETKQLTATIAPTNATNKELYWVSTNDTVATVSESGLVTAVDAGETNIRAYAENCIVAECTVIVMPSFIGFTIASGTCGSNLIWTLDSNGKLTISGKGAMKDYEFRSTEDYRAYKDQIYQVIIKAGVTQIGKYAFYGFSKLDGISIANTVETISMYAFSGCERLPFIVLPNSLKSIGRHAFKGCKRLTNVQIPQGVSRIEDCTFASCESFTEIELANSITYIGEDSFRDCTNLKRLIVNNRNCEFYNYKYSIPESTIIYGYLNSTAQSYANKYNKTFIAIDGGTNQPEPNPLLCPQCGQVHEGFFGKIIGFFHKLIYRLTHLFG